MKTYTGNISLYDALISMGVKINYDRTYYRLMDWFVIEEGELIVVTEEEVHNQAENFYNNLRQES